MMVLKEKTGAIAPREPILARLSAAWAVVLRCGEWEAQPVARITAHKDSFMHKKLIN